MLLLQLHPMGRKGNRSTDISEYRKGYEDRCREVFSLPEQHCLKQNPYSFNIAEKEAACNLFFIPFLYFLSRRIIIEDSGWGRKEKAEVSMSFVPKKLCF